MTEPDQRYFFLENKAGEILGSGMKFSRRVTDDQVWLWRDGTLALVAEPEVSYNLASQPVDGDIIDIAGKQLRVRRGSSRLPSVHLQELKATGLTIVDNILDAAAASALRAAAIRKIPADEIQVDGRVSIPHGLTACAEVAVGVTHPLALWLIETYLGSEQIHFCHQPAVTILRPVDELAGTFPESGWHSDYPYHPYALEPERWSDEAPLAVQYNICVDAFRADNAATQYVPGSHEQRAFPPAEFNEGGTRMGAGIHRDVKQMLAPAGAALIYDARVWHRACAELNVSGQDRVAVLNAVALDWVRPMADKTPGAMKFREADYITSLTVRERQDIQKLCLSDTATPPPDAPEIHEREVQS